MRIALVQQHASSDLRDNESRGEAALEEAARAGADLVAFPELAFLPFLPQVPSAGPLGQARFAQTIPGPLTESFSSLARRHGLVVVLNLFESDGERTYDSSPVIDADGRLLGTTRMVHIMEGPGFHERGYYAPGSNPKLVYETAAGRVGVAICYDRHFPEYMRALALRGAQLVVIPQAGTPDEWGEGVYEGEVQIASLQNGYFGALCNRVGKEDVLRFAGESFVTDPGGRVVARAPAGVDHILYADLDLGLVETSHARTHFLPDRRPDLYRDLGLVDPN
jgi:N-carbamoylputrescine amidase